jgi:hypothetical protein
MHAMRTNFNLYKIVTTQRPGRAIGSERLTIKKFSSSLAMYNALEKEGECMIRPFGWKECEYGPEFMRTAKPGVYARAAGKWHNVKSLDSSVLAHI